MGISIRTRRTFPRAPSAQHPVLLGEDLETSLLSSSRPVSRETNGQAQDLLSRLESGRYPMSRPSTTPLTWRTWSAGARTLVRSTTTQTTRIWLSWCVPVGNPRTLMLLEDGISPPQIDVISSAIKSQWSPSTAKDQAGSVSLRRGSGATPGLRTQDPEMTSMRRKNLGMRDLKRSH